MESEESKAVQEIAKFGSKALDSGDKLGAFLSKVFGTVPSDVVGVLGGDWLHHIRIRNAAKLAQRTEEILNQRGIAKSTEAISPSVALPILIAAQDETREEIRELWSRLLANGMDPERRINIRRSIIDTIKNFDPFDAVLLKKAFEMTSNDEVSKEIPYPIAEIDASYDEIEVSIKNLNELECIDGYGTTQKDNKLVGISLHLTALGREVLRATSL